MTDRSKLALEGTAAARAFAPAPAAARSAPRSQDPAAPPRSRGLAVLIGRTRARMLARLQRPQSTETLARELGLAASTVSEHLTTLASVGVVSCGRSGRRVQYQLNERGHELLRLFTVAEE